MAFSPLKLVWLVAGLAAAGVAGHALLVALPRRTATLARLAALDSCLVAANQQRARIISGTCRTIEQAVSRNRNQAQDVAVLRHTKAIVDSTQTLADSLRQLQRRWPAGSPARLAALLAQVARYTDTLYAWVPDVRSLPETSSETGRLAAADLPRQPAPVGRAALTRLETQLWQATTGVVQHQAAKVGFSWGFDKIGAQAVPTTNTVVSGAPYEARLLLTAAWYRRLSMQADGRPIPVDLRTNQGVVTLRVPPARPGQPDTVRAQWQGQVRFRQPLADTVLTIAVPYLIVKTARP